MNNIFYPNQESSSKWLTYAAHWSKWQGQVYFNMTCLSTAWTNTFNSNELMVQWKLWENSKLNWIESTKLAIWHQFLFTYAFLLIRTLSLPLCVHCREQYFCSSFKDKQRREMKYDWSTHSCWNRKYLWNYDEILMIRLC